MMTRAEIEAALVEEDLFVLAGPGDTFHALDARGCFVIGWAPQARGWGWIHFDPDGHKVASGEITSRGDVEKVSRFLDGGVPIGRSSV
jgi:hypothetical protein